MRKKTFDFTAVQTAIQAIMRQHPNGITREELWTQLEPNFGVIDRNDRLKLILTKSTNIKVDGAFYVLRQPVPAPTPTPTPSSPEPASTITADLPAGTHIVVTTSGGKSFTAILGSAAKMILEFLK